MGALSKEIGRLEREHALNAARTLRELWAKYPHLDHPAVPLVEEMVEIIKDLQNSEHYESCMDGGSTHLCQKAKTLLQKIRKTK